MPGFCLINRSMVTVNHAEPGGAIRLLKLTPQIYAPFFHPHTYPSTQLHDKKATAQTLCPQSSFFPGRRHVLIECLRVLEL